MDTLRLGSCTVDLARLVFARDDGVQGRLTGREAELLVFLSRRGGAPASRRELLREVWQYSDRVVSRAVDSTVQRLRAKIEVEPGTPEHLVTVEGGYALRTGRLAASPSAEATRLVGRDDERAGLADALGGPGLVTLYGPPGVGKSRLAREVARLLPCETLTADLVEARDRADVARTVAGALDLPLGRGDAADQVGRALSARGEVLLLLDGADAVAAPVAELAGRWTDWAPRLRVLVTIRERLAAPDERAIELPPLSRDGAIELFFHRARLARPDVDLERPVIGEIVDQLDRIPLAIELAAARVRVLGPRQMLQRLDERLRLLSDPSRSVRSAIDGSWELLSPAERAALAGCAVFRGGFTMEAAEAVLDLSLWDADVLDTIQALRDRSLLRTVATRTGAIRLALYESVRVYAIEKLEQPEVRDRHARWFGELGQDERHEHDIRVAARVEPERANLVAAFDHAVSVGDPIAVNLASSLVTLHVYRGPVLDGARYPERALALPLDDARRARLLNAVLRCRYRSQPIEWSLELSQELVALSRGLSPARIAPALHARALVLIHAGRSEEAGALLEEARGLAAGVGDEAVVGVCIGTLGHLARVRGRHDEARAHYAEALRRARQRGEEHGEALYLGNLGLVYKHEGNLDAARQSLESAAALARDLGDRVSEVAALDQLGTIDFDRGDLDRAIALHEEALEGARRLGMATGQLEGNLALAYQAAGRRADARRVHLRSIAVLQVHGHPRALAIAEGNLGELELLEGDLTEARNRLERALALVEPSDQVVLGAFLAARAELEAAEGRHDLAAATIEEAERVLRDAGSRIELVKCLARKGIVAARAARTDDARAARDEAEAVLREVGAGPRSEAGQAVARLAALL